MATAFRSGTLGLIQHLFDEGTCTGLSDARLLERFVTRGDEPAFAALVARHGAMVLTTCQAALKDPGAADDAFQATFVLLFRKAGSIRIRFGGVEGRRERSRHGEAPTVGDSRWPGRRRGRETANRRGDLQHLGRAARPRARHAQRQPDGRRPRAFPHRRLGPRREVRCAGPLTGQGLRADPPRRAGRAGRGQGYRRHQDAGSEAKWGVRHVGSADASKAWPSFLRIESNCIMPFLIAIENISQGPF
jgi:hypothetical protein